MCCFVSFLYGLWQSHNTLKVALKTQEMAFQSLKFKIFWGACPRTPLEISCLRHSEPITKLSGSIPGSNAGFSDTSRDLWIRLNKSDSENFGSRHSRICRLRSLARGSSSLKKFSCLNNKTLSHWDIFESLSSKAGCRKLDNLKRQTETQMSSRKFDIWNYTIVAWWKVMTRTFRLLGCLFWRAVFIFFSFEYGFFSLCFLTILSLLARYITDRHVHLFSETD